MKKKVELPTKLYNCSTINLVNQVIMKQPLQPNRYVRKLDRCIIKMVTNTYDKCPNVSYEHIYST